MVFAQKTPENAWLSGDFKAKLYTERNLCIDFAMDEIIYPDLLQNAFLQTEDRMRYYVRVFL
jgi:hypothetical protein